MWYDPVFEKRISKIVKKYFFGYFFFDCLACIPVLAYEASNEFSMDPDEKARQIQTFWYPFYWALKMFKLFIISRII